MLTIEGETRVDYFHVLCEQCSNHVRIDYKGFVGGVPEIEASCPNCEESGTFKLMVGDWHGLPFEPAN